MSFDIAELRDLNKSYLDSAIVELCLPGSEYSPQALYHILNTVEQETPRELKRCPQIMWDTVGDLAVCASPDIVLGACKLKKFYRKQSGCWIWWRCLFLLQMERYK